MTLLTYNLVWLQLATSFISLNSVLACFFRKISYCFRFICVLTISKEAEFYFFEASGQMIYKIGKNEGSGISSIGRLYATFRNSVFRMMQLLVLDM